MATDGVWDNIFDQDIQSCVNYHLKRDGSLKSVDDVSKCISTLAEAKSYDKTWESPFYVEAKKMGAKEDADTPGSQGGGDLGGKEDDITVIVS